MIERVSGVKSVRGLHLQRELLVWLWHRGGNWRTETCPPASPVDAGRHLRSGRHALAPGGALGRMPPSLYELDTNRSAHDLRKQIFNFHAVSVPNLACSRFVRRRDDRHI